MFVVLPMSNNTIRLFALRCVVCAHKIVHWFTSTCFIYLGFRTAVSVLYQRNRPKNRFASDVDIDIYATTWLSHESALMHTHGRTCPGIYLFSLLTNTNDIRATATAANYVICIFEFKAHPRSVGPSRNLIWFWTISESAKLQPMEFWESFDANAWCSFRRKKPTSPRNESTKLIA